MVDGDGYTSPAPAQPTYRTPLREDCWSENATHTLIEAWGDRHLDLNRGNLRQKHWQEVADTVNAVHRHPLRTDVQCKNRIDTLKKKYKIEKSRFSKSKTTHWPFFARLHHLIGSTPSPPPPRRKTLLPPLPSSVPVGPRSKRPVLVDDSSLRRNFSAMAAVAAAAAAAAEAEERTRSKLIAGSERGEECRLLAEAIEGLGEIYERVEEVKQRQVMELEKQRMQFAKDLEIQRMKIFMDSQIQLEKIKRERRNSETDGYF